MCCHWIRQRVNLAHPRVIISIISGKYCVISNAGYTTEHLICSLSARNVSLLLAQHQHLLLVRNLNLELTIKHGVSWSAVWGGGRRERAGTGFNVHNTTGPIMLAGANMQFNDVFSQRRSMFMFFSPSASNWITKHQRLQLHHQTLTIRKHPRRLIKVPAASICFSVRYLTCMTQQYFTQRRLH